MTIPSIQYNTILLNIYRNINEEIILQQVVIKKRMEIITALEQLKYTLIRMTSWTFKLEPHTIFPLDQGFMVQTQFRLMDFFRSRVRFQGS